ncbi:Ig-like domain repeat protein [Nocardia sp. CA-107356]|uniref:Ig-like domain repeat protein n=1 Tax=Nocardia sp. CA-107356 TaxID=3239972 RepID=UPI003D8BFCF8
MQAFNPNDYRKRVLADVERRGGIEESDPFELYDIPLEEAESLSDAEVAARVEEVWGFWQRQRDHPKYRVLVGLLVDAHATLSRLLLDSAVRRAETVRVREVRARRDADRYEMLDAAISRLVQRHGGVPAGKIPGLEEIGAMGGLSAAEVATRLRRHRVIEDTPVPAGALTDQRRQQIRQLLSEWERLIDGDPTPTLFALLRVDPSKAGQSQEIRLRAEALRARSRELPPGRVRVVLDELLIHIHDVLESGEATLHEYLRAVAEDVARELRPKVRAAVLVEDELVGDDFHYLLDEAMRLGLDRADATRVLTEIATELGARVDNSPHSAPTPRGPAQSPIPPAPRLWEVPLKAARAALRGGRPREAARHVDEARRLVGSDGAGLTPIRSVSDEVDRVLTEAEGYWRSATTACAGKRYAEALPHLEQLRRTASDLLPSNEVPSIDQLLAEAGQAIAEADRLVAAAQAGPADTRVRELLAAVAVCADHAGAAAALAETPVEPPQRVDATRLANGSVLVAWSPSSTNNVTYRVTRMQPDGSWRVVGRTHATELEDGGAPAVGQPVYAVAAAVAGRYSEITRSDTGRTAEPRGGQEHSPQDDPAPSGIPAVSGLAEQAGLLIFTWPVGVTEVMAVARPDQPPTTPDDPQARSWKVTNMRYEIDGGIRIPPDIARPCHIAIASCRREPNGKLTVAAGFAATARIRWFG